MSTEFEILFNRLREILKKHDGKLKVIADTPVYYCLAGKVGPAALKAWGGKMKKPVMPAGWVQIGKAYVSYHLMGMYGNTVLHNSLSKELKTRMQGKTCFNFKKIDEPLLKELEQLTAKSIEDFKKAGFMVE